MTISILQNKPIGRDYYGRRYSLQYVSNDLDGKPFRVDCSEICGRYFQTYAEAVAYLRKKPGLLTKQARTDLERFTDNPLVYFYGV